MTIIGLTGSLGTGKSTVAKQFKALGAIVLDADKIAHEVMRPGKEAYRKIVKTFGRKIVKSDKSINRSQLGEIVFGKRGYLKKLGKIVHPKIIQIMNGRLKSLSRKGSNRVVVLDAPLLIEAGLTGLVDYLVVVKTDRKTQIKRCIKKTGLSRKEIQSRIKAQMPMGEKIRLSDFRIDNSGTKNETKREVRKIWQKVQ